MTWRWEAKYIKSLRGFGDYLYSKEYYKGYFGIDFVVDVETYEVFFMEMNPRETAGTGIGYQYFHVNG